MIGLYVVALILFQARSAIFEFAVVFLFPLLMWAGDRVKLKYLVFTSKILIIPNIILLWRFELIEDPSVLIEGLFSFEYTIMLNKILGAVIEMGAGPRLDLSFLPHLVLVIPSPVRDIFGIKPLDMVFLAIYCYTPLSLVAGSLYWPKLIQTLDGTRFWYFHFSGF